MRALLRENDDDISARSAGNDTVTNVYNVCTRGAGSVYTSPVTRATSKSGGREGEDDIICIRDFTPDSFASDATRREPRAFSLAAAKNVIFCRPCFVTRGLQFTIRAPRFTIPLERTCGLSALSPLSIHISLSLSLS